MSAFAYYPLYLFTFWYKDVIGNLIEFFVQFNRYISSLFSLPLLIKTFFKPVKNEYRDGLVLFSIFFGMFIKSVLITTSLLIVLFILIVEVMVVIFLLVLPILLLALLFRIPSIPK